MNRPDLVLRNKINNPMSNPISREKMRQSLIGKQHSQETKQKMSDSHKKAISQDPTLVTRMLMGTEEKYLSKVRGKGWRLVRLKALQRDHYICQECGETKKRLVVHHIDWRGKRRDISQKEMNNDLSNLVTLCDKCHNAIHRHKSDDYHNRYEEITGEKRWE